MMDQSKVFQREELGCRGWKYVKIWEWEDSRLLPALNISLNFRRPEHVRLLRRQRALFLHRHVHIRTAAIVLRAVPTFVY